DQPLPPAIRGALTSHAAHDLARTNLDQAISARRAGWLGGTLAGLFAGIVVLFLLGPRQFSSLVGRVFSPFEDVALATRTSITVVRPEGGDATISVGRAVSVAARVEGKVPDPSRPDGLRFLFRYQPTDPYETRPLERGEAASEWTVLVPAQDVRNGFWYKVA